MKVQGVTLDVLNMNFDKFSKNALSNKNNNLKNFVIGLDAQEAQFKSNGYLETFAEKLYTLTQELMATEKVNFAGIVSSNIVKLAPLPFEAKERYIKQAIDVAEAQQDTVHLAARYEDLYGLYLSVNDKSKMLKTLAKEESVLKEIVDDFDTSMKNYRTIVAKHKEKKDFETFLGTIKVDFAKLLIRSKPHKAAQKLQQAMEIFQRLKRKDLYDFAQRMLFEIQYCKRQSK